MQHFDIQSSSDDDVDTSYQPLVVSSTLSKFTSVPSPPYKKVPIDTKPSGRVLTASENLKWIEEKRIMKGKKQQKSKCKSPENPDCGNYGYFYYSVIMLPNVHINCRCKL